MPTKERKQTSAAGRQDGGYKPPILAEPRGGPVPGAGQKPDASARRTLDAELRWGIGAARHLPGKHNQISHAHGGLGGSDDNDDGQGPAEPVPTVKVRTQEGSMHLSRQGGRLSIRMPVPDFDDDIQDTVTLDADTATEFAEELQLLEEAGTGYNRRVKKLWDKAVAINPDGGGDDDADPESKAAWDAVGELAGDGQRIAGGQLDADDGAELHYELRMGDEPGDMDLLIAIRPPDAGEDWDLQAAAADEAGSFLSWPQMKKVRREVDGLLADNAD